MPMVQPAAMARKMALPAVRVGTLQWTVGIYCILAGALRWAAPIAATRFGLKSDFEWTGPALLAAGAGLLLVPVTRPSRALTVAAHILAGVALFVVASWYVVGGVRAGGVLYGILGLVTLGAGAVAAFPRRPASRTVDLFVLAVGLALVGSSIALLTTGEAVGPFMPAEVRQHFMAYLAVLTAAGGLLLVTELSPRTPLWASSAVRLATAALMGVWLVATALPNHLWPGVLFWGGFGGVLALLPWLGPRLAHADPTSLHIRIALALAAAATLPLVLVVSIITARGEAVDIEQSLAAQQTLANVLTEDVSDSLVLQRAAMATLAEQLTADDGSMRDPQLALIRFAGAFPDIFSISAIDSSGARIAQHGPELGLPMPRTGADFGLSRMEAMYAPALRQPVVVVDVPILDANRRPRGRVEAVLASETIATTLRRADPNAGAIVYLVDSSGRLVAHSEAVASFEDQSDNPAVAALLAQGEATGAVRYGTSVGPQFAAYARVPDLGWGIVVERPASAVLASTRAEQDAVFGVLLLAIFLAAGLGAMVAKGIAAPLASLAGAADRIAIGDPYGPPLHVPTRGPAEVVRLAGAFRDMRDRLASRTAERDRDAAELKQAYLELQATEAGRSRLAAILEATNDLVAIGTPDLSVRYMNGAGRRLLGLGEGDEITRMTLADLRPERARAAFVQEAIPTANRAGIWVGESAILTPDGVEVPTLDVLLAHRTLDGAVESYSTVARDISQLKQMEAQLLRGQRLETAGRIAGQVAHDFNNLLAPLVGYPELIKLQLPADHPVIGFADAMAQSAQQMANINQDLLALGRRAHVERHPTDLNLLAEQAVAQLVSVPPTLTIACQLAPDLLPVHAAESQLLRVLLNLLTNARDAMEDVGRLDVRTENVYLDRPTGGFARVPTGEYVRLAVTDTGGGISPEIRDRIFDPFFTTKTSQRRRGSGLGLSVVQSIVEDHEGYVDLESAPGQGTTFRLYFPVCREPVVVDAADALVGGHESLLVVDDDPVQRVVTRDLLEALGYSVSAVESGEEAVAYASGHEADLVLLDMVMTGIDGAETYQRLLERHPGQRAIILSGYAASDRVALAQQLGAGTFLRKPVTLAVLAREVRQELDREPARRTAAQ